MELSKRNLLIFFRNKVFRTNFRRFIFAWPKLPVIEIVVNTKKWTNAGLFQIMLLGVARKGAQ
jgi:hypothetical protein